MTSKFKRLAAAAAVFMAASLGATQASAHTTAFGYDSLLDGTVDFWLGTYHSFAESPTTEESLTLSGPGAAGPYAFTMPSSTLPTGLDVYTENTNVTILSWQGVNVSGLLDGAFTADITGMSSAKWARSTSRSFGFPWPFTFTLDVVDVPEPGTLAILGFGLAGLGFARRRKAP